jgi:protein-S-isoprenylcysteine O-methyltransferase Ste14
MADWRRHTDFLSRIRSRLDRLTRSPIYDLAMRVPVIGWSTALSVCSAAGLEQFMHAADPALPSAIFAVEAVMRLSVIAYLAILAATVVMRKPPISKLRGAQPRASAFIGTFLITVVVLFPRRELSLAAGIASTLLILTGDGFAVVALVQLRRSFSIMPEARELVITGPYRLVRHPLYLAEAVATIGCVMQVLSVWTVILLALQLMFQLRRIENEEVVLTQAFPRYAVYKQTTARLIPGIY